MYQDSSNRPEDSSGHEGLQRSLYELRYALLELFDKLGLELDDEDMALLAPAS